MPGGQTAETEKKVLLVNWQLNSVEWSDKYCTGNDSLRVRKVFYSFSSPKIE